jgi:hypothetical protein
MSKKRFNVSQAKDIPGRDKPIWLKHGVAFQSEDGKVRIKLESLPLPNAEGEVWLNLFEDDGQGAQQQPVQQPMAPGGLDDEINF